MLYCRYFILLLLGETMSMLLRVWTSVLTVIGIVLSMKSTSLRFYHGSLLNYTTTPLEEPLRLLPLFNKTLVSMFYLFGFNETTDSEDANVMLSAYLSTGYTNVVLVDWSTEARIIPGGVVLSYLLRVVLNSRLVGRSLGKALVSLIQNGISETKIHLVGHSLGAHVAGFAGEYVKENDLELARITGLDPAGPLFEGVVRGLDSSRAKFVDVLHTNPGQFGITNAIGSVDFWANCGDSLQPGCPDSKQMLDYLNTFCSHWRSYLYFSEAILSPISIPAARADNCTSWQHRANSSSVIYLGDLVDTGARGNYFFTTRSQKRFSKGQAGLNNKTSN